MSISETSSSTYATLLSYDLLVYIFDVYRNDYAQLARCSLVDWEFNRAASKLLYWRVVLGPASQPVLNLRDLASIPAGSNLPSALLPRNAPYVTSLEVSGAVSFVYPHTSVNLPDLLGYLSPRPPPRNTLPETLLNAVKAFTNLTRVKFTPITYHEDLFTEPLKVLKDAPSLRCLTASSSCMDEERANLLAEIGGLDKLTLKDPTRAILQLLPDWLGRLSSSLTELHLLDNCGSVTPGVLRSFLPPLKQNIRAFTLGLSYSLTDEDVFTFVGELCHLEVLQLRYYWQLKRPLHQPPLPNLRTFIVNHPRMYSKDEVLRLCKWIRCAISSSSIETLRIAGDMDEDEIISTFAYDSLIDHLAVKQSSSLKIFDFRASYIGVRGMKKLLTSCSFLEEIYICGGRDTLSIFETYRKVIPHLRIAWFDIRNVKRHRYRMFEEQFSFLFSSCPSLRRVTVNGRAWERESNLNIWQEPVAREVHSTKFPWEKDREPPQGTLAMLHI